MEQEPRREYKDTPQGRGISSDPWPMSAHAKQTLRWTGWTPSRRQVVWTLVIGVLLTVTILVVLGYVRTWEWVGIQGKTLWDWMELLIVPGVLALGAFELNQRAKQRAKQREQQSTLLQELHNDFSQAYDAAKKIRSILKAEAKYETHDKKKMIKMARYFEQMELLIDVQVRFESLLRRYIRTVYLGPNAVLKQEDTIKQGDTNVFEEPVRANLRQMDHYLYRVVREYQEVYNTRPNDGQISRTDVPASKLPALEEFLTAERFVSDFRRPADEVSAALQGMILSTE